jgi:hypothetical protein
MGAPLLPMEGGAGNPVVYGTGRIASIGGLWNSLRLPNQVHEGLRIATHKAMFHGYDISWAEL